MKETIRNFCIIAHINHGKSTLADRLLEVTGTVASAKMRAQFLDSNPIERERGITIKLAPVRMSYKLPEDLKKTFNFEFLTLNLIDTPGHVDFSYEVSRSLAACEGAILVVDAVSGVQAQTLANLALAKKQGLAVIPVINKIDLKIAQPEKVASQLVNQLGFKKKAILFISAKKGKNVDQVLRAIVKKIPPPGGSELKPFRALVFNSTYDLHKGVVVWIRVVDGKIGLKGKAKTKIRFLSSGATAQVSEMGYFSPQLVATESLGVGEVGYLTTGLKEISLTQVGDTIGGLEQVKVEPLPGYKKVKPMVFAGFYPLENKDLPFLAKALQKLSLSDAALSFVSEASQGLGKGFRCGFLGLLHAEIVQERLEREFGVGLVMTPPTVEFQVRTKKGQLIKVLKAADFPDSSQIQATYEPMVLVSIFTPLKFLNPIISYCKIKRARFLSQEYFGDQLEFKLKMPLSEMAVDFYDQIKNLSSGFASLDWKEAGFEKLPLVRLDILLNGQQIEAFSRIVPRRIAAKEGKRLVRKLRELIPRQLFTIVVQAAIGGKIIAREEIKPFKKDVTAKLYGGDQTRKMKLLEKQKRGKKRMKQIGKVSLPQEAFLEVFKK